MTPLRPHFISRTRLLGAGALLLALSLFPGESRAQRDPDEADRSGASSAEKDETKSAGDPSGTGEGASAKKATDPSDLEFNACLRKIPQGKKFDFAVKPSTELNELVELVSKFTCKRFLLSDTLRAQKVTIITPTRVTPGEVYQAFLSALDVMGLTVVPAGKYLKIVQGNWAIQGPIPTFGDKDRKRVPNTDEVVTQIIEIKNVDVNELLLVLNKLKSRNGDVTAYKASNSLIITDNAYNIRRMLYLVKELDIETEGEKIWVVRLKYADPQEVNKILSQLFAAQGTTARPQLRRPGERIDQDASDISASKIVSDTASNSLILVASTASFNRIASLIKKLDVEEDAATQKIHVYYLENADAEDLSSTIGALTGTGGASNVRGRRQPRRPGSGQQAASLFEGDVKISADKPTNSLVIVATAKDYLNLRAVIKQLDIPRRQVFIEASVLEISMDRNRTIGFAYHGGGVAGEGDSESLIFGGVEHSDWNSLLINPLSMMGLAVGVRGAEIEGSGTLLGVGADIPAFGVMFQALQNNSDVNTLSTPHILTTDNEEAEITVGQNLPFQGSIMGGGLGSALGGAAGAAGGAAASLASLYGGVSVQRQDVALKMKITPHVNESDMVRLELEQEVSDIVSQNFNGLGPATSKRSAKTVVVVRDQQTVVIGGLMSNRIRNSVSKVPILGDIPILGYLFKYKKKITEKTNLLIVLTPYIIRDQTDLRRILKKKLEERREFIERYTSFEHTDIITDVDFRHKRGLLAEINRVASQAEAEAKLLEEARKASDDEDITPIKMPTGMTVTPAQGGPDEQGDVRPSSEIREPDQPELRQQPQPVQRIQ